MVIEIKNINIKKLKGRQLNKKWAQDKVISHRLEFPMSARMLIVSYKEIFTQEALEYLRDNGIYICQTLEFIKEIGQFARYGDFMRGYGTDIRRMLKLKSVPRTGRRKQNLRPDYHLILEDPKLKWLRDLIFSPQYRVPDVIIPQSPIIPTQSYISYPNTITLSMEDYNYIPSMTEFDLYPNLSTYTIRPKGIMNRDSSISNDSIILEIYQSKEYKLILEYPTNDSIKDSSNRETYRGMDIDETVTTDRLDYGILYRMHLIILLYCQYFDHIYRLKR